FVQLIRSPEYVSRDATETSVKIDLQSERYQADEHTDADATQTTKEQDTPKCQEQRGNVMFEPDATHKRFAYTPCGTGVGGETCQLHHGIATEGRHQYQGRAQGRWREAIQTGVF